MGIHLFMAALLPPTRLISRREFAGLGFSVPFLGRRGGVAWIFFPSSASRGSQAASCRSRDSCWRFERLGANLSKSMSLRMWISSLSWSCPSNSASRGSAESSSLVFALQAGPNWLARTLRIDWESATSRPRGEVSRGFWLDRRGTARPARKRRSLLHPNQSDEQTGHGGAQGKVKRQRARLAPWFGSEVWSRRHERPGSGRVHRTPRRAARFEKSSVNGMIGSTFVAMVKA